MTNEGTVFALQMARPSWGLDKQKEAVLSEKEIKMFSSIVVLSCKIQ